MPVLAVLTAFLIAGAAYLGMGYWNNFQREKQAKIELARQEKEKQEIARSEEKAERDQKDKLRDEELAVLRQELENLKNKPVASAKVAAPAVVENKEDTAAVVREWSPRVAHMECSWYTTKNVLYAKASGSATLVNFTNLGLRAITNKHILVDKYNYAPRECKVTLVDNTSYLITINEKNVLIGEDEDWAYVSLLVDQNLSRITQGSIKLCPKVEVGDKLLVLGYPKIGSSTGLTATEGIVSGDDKNYYITSAKIDKGNSGGAAILLKDDCYLGIPSASAVGSIESLGRILKAKFVIAS